MAGALSESGAAAEATRLSADKEQQYLEVLCHRDSEAKALEVLRGTSRRRELAPNGIFDAGLCHGAASVALMYHYMYGQTGETLFAETRDYWIGETLRMGRLEEGLAGYGAWHGVEYGGWKREYGLLEGIAGIGLMLLAALANDPKSDQWMRFFMLH